MFEFIFPLLTSLLLLWSVRRWFYKPSGNKNPPPSPPKLPIIGNLHQLGSLPHRNLHALAKKHGPVMLLRFGSVPVLIVSSADAAREIMKDHDITFSSRPIQKITNKITYNGKDIAFAPYGEYWRKWRSVFVLRLLSNRRVQSGSSIREEETAVFMNKIRESKGPVNLSKMFGEYMNDVVCRSAFGRKYSGSEKGEKFMQLFKESAELSGSFNVGDYIPWLSWMNGVYKRVEEVVQGIDDFFEDLIQERIEARNKMVSCRVEEEKGENFVDIMLDIQNENTAGDLSIDRDIIKAMILDVFGGGTDTISTTMEWAMTELLRHPRVMLKVQNEVRGIMKEKQDITSKDLENMHYLLLKAFISFQRLLSFIHCDRE